MSSPVCTASYVRKNQIATIPVYMPKSPSKVPNNDGLERYSDVASQVFSGSDTANERTLYDKVLERSGRSLLTDEVCASIEMCRVLNTIRMDSSDCETLVEDEVTFKEFLEMYYTALGFSGKNNFRFDFAENCVPLESNYHMLWGTYGLFCFTPSLELLKHWSRLLKDENEMWQPSEARSDSVFNIMIQELREEGLQVLIIDPRNFLPNDRHILISNSERNVAYKNSTLPFLQRANSRLPPTYQPSVKYPYKVVNGIKLYVSPFAIIVNAYSKIVDRNFKKIVPRHTFGLAYLQALDRYREGLRTLVQEIFYLPAGHPFRSTPGFPQSDETIQDGYATDATMKGSHSHGCDSEDPECLEQDHNESCHVTSQDRESSDDEDSNELSASSPFFGLTPQDIQTAARKSVDPRVDADERIMAALMLGGMLRSGLKVSD
ncbi:hypothetical protein VNI00_014590 [Paramarasmius palmivorus]|uniref:Uncharacterized protein n=1 Tax=Paramarasmius palmivorus TaxID=297713 RepID=A0AAW0BQI7_9AGAR